MNRALLIIQIVISILLVGSILIQSKGTGFARSFKSQASFTRRGLEKIVFRATFVLALLFIVVSILQLAS